MNVNSYTDDTKLTHGLWRLPAEAYHADPCPAPSLSAGILRTLLTASPAHAYHAHPRLGNGTKQDSTKAAEFGQAVHKLALNFGADLTVIDARDYRGGAAQKARSEAVQEGKIPILVDAYADALNLATAMREAAEAYLGLPVDKCLREVAVIWEVGGFWSRAMIDVMTPDLRRVVDLKSTQASAAPEPSVRRLYDALHHVQQAHYVSGLDALNPDGRGRRRFAFIFGEAQAPYLVGPPLEISEAGRTLGEAMRKVGTLKWNSCLTGNFWPGYAPEPMVAEPPAWILSQWMYRLNSDESLNPLEAENG